MTVKRMRWMACVGLALLAPGLASAQDAVWRAVARTAPPAVAASSNPSSTTPIATLGKPVPLAATTPAATLTAPNVAKSAAPAPLARGGSIAPVQYRPAAVLGGRATAIIRCQAPADPDPLLSSEEAPQPGITTAVGSPSVSAKPEDAVPTTGSAVGTAPAVPDAPEGVTTHTAAGPTDPPPPAPPVASPPDVVPGAVTDRPVAPGFWEKCKGWMQWGDKGGAGGHGWFQSDTCFPGLISPVTNPFFFEDPRSLTEIRPILMYQGIPSRSPYPGGDAFFFGTQARLAFTDRFSVVMNELGFVSLDPNSGPSDTSFTELKIGPKYTFLLNAASGTVAAAGLTLEIPTDGNRLYVDKTVYQSAGGLGLDPYVTIGQTFGKLPNGFGTINLMGEVGYSFGTDNQRAEFFHSSFHIDYNIANMNKFYPLIELNWLRYTSGGKNNLAPPYEGGDLVNFGAAPKEGDDDLRIAFGLRYRFTDHIFAGAAVEIPLAHERGLEDYRVTFDMIFRY